MRKLFSNRAFVFGFALDILLFSVINFLSYTGSRASLCGSPPYSFGFPYNFYKEYLDKSCKTSGQILWFGLIADVFITITLSFLLGLIFKFIWSKFASRRINLK